MNNSEIRVSVIVPTHNRADALEITLKYLAQQQFAETWEVMVVNNNCTDDTDEVFERAKKDFSVPVTLVHEQTPGAAATRNAGANAAQGEYLVFIDNDILTEPDFLQRHYDALTSNRDSWIIGQVVNLPEQEQTVFGKYRKTLFPVLPRTAPIRETDGITGQTVSLPRRHFLELNGFDENFDVASGEDHEFAMRGRKQLGAKTFLLPSILVVHNDWAGTTIEDFSRRQRIYSQTEFYFWRKYGDEHPRRDLVRENFPAEWGKDSTALFVRKKIKSATGHPAAQKVLSGACAVLEKVLPVPFVLWRLYKLTLAGAIYRGFQEGREKVLARENAAAKP